MSSESFHAGTTRPDERRAVMRLSGELDMAGTFVLEPQLDELVDAPPRDEVLFDLREVTFLDSTGLAVLLGANDRLRAAGVRARFVRGSDDLQRIFAVAGLDEALDFVDAPG